MNHLPPPLAGIFASAGSIVTSFQVHLDWSVRFAGSVIFLLIAILSLVRAFREFRNK